MVIRPPGVGMNPIQAIQLEKYFCCAANNPMSLCASVPKTTSTIIQEMVKTKILVLDNKEITRFINSPNVPI
jgi:hypothetical protein